MPRYMVQRTFPEGLRIPMTAEGSQACGSVVKKNAESGVTWLHSYVTPDLRKSFCLYDGPSPEAIRESAANSNLPIDSITPVSVLDTYFYRS
jgi:hypothetical protein